MEEDSPLRPLMLWGSGALGLGAVTAAIALPRPMGIWIALFILLFALLLFGGYYLWRRHRARRQREQFTSAIEAQTSAAPRSISDPKKRADLDKVRNKFQTGLQEFKSRGKDIYKLPWYVIIGESGSGKTEAIRHSEIDFPPGLNKEHQGTGGTVNMDWWFTNRGVILDTAGSMLFPEAGAAETPEWQEFLRLLKKARPQCPVNGLFLVLSIESLIKDSAERIAQKATRLAQHLDLIQRTLDVRFPVYLLVTKSDLLTGFREFFDSIDDPLLQHQIFGWSNPDPLDSPFRPDLIEQHLGGVAERLRRRRLALLREAAASGGLGHDTQQFFAHQLGRPAGQARRLDQVDSLFALPESIMRLAPRLRRYLETVFVAGEWSAKPVFLRGVYFTSSMREGKALDEAIAFATGLPLEQLPEDRTWEKNRAFFLRDLFHEKVFRESGLVTRATNTLKLLRQRQLAIFGSAGGALLLLLIFAGFAAHNLKVGVLKEAAYWQAGANNWDKSTWSPAIVRPGGPEDPLHFSYNGAAQIEIADKPTIVDYHKNLKKLVEKGFSVGWVFKPISWFSKVQDRPEAQCILFEGGVLRPLVIQTRNKLEKQVPSADDPAGVGRNRDALLALIQLEADKLSGAGRFDKTNATQKAERYLKSFLSYLTDSDHKPDTNLVAVFAWTYSGKGSGSGKWPSSLSGGDRLSNNSAIRVGLENFRRISQTYENRIAVEVQRVNNVVSSLATYKQSESQWLSRTDPQCTSLSAELVPSHDAVAQAWSALRAMTNTAAGPLTNLAARYIFLQNAAKNASVGAFATIANDIPDQYKTSGIIYEIFDLLKKFAGEAAHMVATNYDARKPLVAELDVNYVTPLSNTVVPNYEVRWQLYTGACAIAESRFEPADEDFGTQWKRFTELVAMVNQFRTNLTGYTGPFAETVSTLCNRMAGDAELKLKGKYVDAYVQRAANKMSSLANRSDWDIDGVTNARAYFSAVARDLNGCDALGPDKAKLSPARASLTNSTRLALQGIQYDVKRKLGFPLRLNEDPGMPLPLPRVCALRSLLAGLTRELQDPLWQIDSSGALVALRADREVYDSVASALIKDDNTTPTDWELFFVPPEDGDEKGRLITSIFRLAQVSIGNKTSDWTDVTRARTPLSLGTAFAESALKISFRKVGNNPAETNVINQALWGLPRIIRDSNPPFQQPKRFDNGLRWRFGLTLADGPNSGDATFEARLLDPKRPLPKLEEWPR